jgi:hypothetical protein
MGLQAAVRSAASSAFKALGDLKSDVTVHFVLTGLLIDPGTLLPVPATIAALSGNIGDISYLISKIGQAVTEATETVKAVVVRDSDHIVPTRLVATSRDAQLLRIERDLRMVVQESSLTREPVLYDYIDYASKEWWIIAVYRDPAGAVFTFDVREK